jgi:hypothetical protein
MLADGLRGFRVQLRLTVGFGHAIDSSRRRGRGEIDWLDDCVVNRVTARCAMCFSNETEESAYLRLESSVAIRAIDRNAGLARGVVFVLKDPD